MSAADPVRSAIRGPCANCIHSRLTDLRCAELVPSSLAPSSTGAVAASSPSAVRRRTSPQEPDYELVGLIPTAGSSSIPSSGRRPF